MLVMQYIGSQDSNQLSIQELISVYTTMFQYNFCISFTIQLDPPCLIIVLEPSAEVNEVWTQ